MNIDQKISDISVYVKLMSGFFITQENQKGISPKEIEIFTELLKESKRLNTIKITSQLKENVADRLDTSVQVITNYLATFRKKKMITPTNEFQSCFNMTKVNPIEIKITYYNPTIEVLEHGQMQS